MKDIDLQRGDRIIFSPAYQDAGDANYLFVVVENSPVGQSSVRYSAVHRCKRSRWFIQPRFTCHKYMIDDVVRQFLKEREYA